MSAYITTLKLMDNTVAPESSDENTFAEYAEGASRLFDKLCEVDDGFFGKAPPNASERTFYGAGIDMLELPPFVGDATVTIGGDAFTDFRAVKNYLIRTDDRDFGDGDAIAVTARWGFAEIPKDVQMIVNELACHAYRNRDPLFAKISNVEIERELSPTVNAAIKKYKDKYSQMAF